MQGLRELAHSRWCARKLKDRIVAKQARPYFDAHRRDFDVLTVAAAETAFAYELPENSVGTIMRRTPARFDARTRARIHDLLFREWLAAQRAKATIRWHWMGR